MEALKKSISCDKSAEAESAAPKAKKRRKAAPGQKEMIMAIEGKKPAAKKAAKPERTTWRKASAGIGLGGFFDGIRCYNGTTWLPARRILRTASRTSSSTPSFNGLFHASII
jgi:hypothetical protein